jgi:phage gpG-like protein
MAISVQVKAEKTTSALAALSRGLASRELAMRQIATQFYSWTLRNYNSGGGLRPTPWAPLAPSTVKEKLRLGYSTAPLGPRTGNLRNSFAPFSDKDTAGVGARASFGVDYAAIHEEGTDKIPARPMLPPDDVAASYANRIYGMFVKTTVERTGLA